MQRHTLQSMNKTSPNLETLGRKYAELEAKVDDFSRKVEELISSRQ